MPLYIAEECCARCKPETGAFAWLGTVVGSRISGMRVPAEPKRRICESIFLADLGCDRMPHIIKQFSRGQATEILALATSSLSLSPHLTLLEDLVAPCYPED